MIGHEWPMSGSVSWLIEPRLLSDEQVEELVRCALETGGRTGASIDVVFADDALLSERPRLCGYALEGSAMRVTQPRLRDTVARLRARYSPSALRPSSDRRPLAPA